MPLPRYEMFRTGETLTIGVTTPIELPKSGHLSALLVEVSGTPVNGATLSTEESWLEDFLTAVEVRGNGQFPIKALQWRDLNYLNYLDQQKIGPLWKRNYATTTQRATILILFGRWLFDLDYGLDLSKWNDVKLHLGNVGSATYFTGNLSANVVACYLEDHTQGFVRGYLKTEEFRSWPTVQNKWEYNNLPTTNPLRGVHVQLVADVDANFVAETGLNNLADDLKFSIANPYTLLHDGGVFQRLQLDRYLYPGEFITSAFVDKTADKGFRTGLGYVTGAAGMSGSKDGAGSATIPTMQGDNNNPTQTMETREADSPVQFLFTGLAPENFLTLHYVRDCDPLWLLDPSRHGQIKLDVHCRDASSAADGTVRILTDSIYQNPSAPGAPSR